MSAAWMLTGMEIEEQEAPRKRRHTGAETTTSSPGSGLQQQSSTQGANAGGANTNSNKNVIQLLCRELTRLSMEVKEVRAAVMTVYEIPETHALPASVKKVSAAYGKKVRELGKGHTMGSPHCHVAAQVIREAIKLPSATQTIAKAFNEFIEKASLKDMDSLISTARLTQTHGGPYLLTLAPGQAARDFDGPIQDLYRELMQILNKEFNRKLGMAPKTPGVRALEKLIKKQQPNQD
jgi:hypothetical protein